MFHAGLGPNRFSPNYSYFTPYNLTTKMKLKFALLLLSSLFFNTLWAQKELSAPPGPPSAPPPPPPPPPVEIMVDLNDEAAESTQKAAPSEKVYEMFDVQKPPVFPGGDAEMYKYIAANLQYPALAKENYITGVVAITFVVDTDGKITNIQVIKDIGGGCGKEAMRLIQSMPVWTPGETGGQKVKVRYTLPIRFRLN